MIESPFEKLHPNSLKVNRVSGAIGIFVVVATVATVTAGTFWIAQPTAMTQVLLAGAGVLLSVLAFFLGWLYPRFAYENASWKLDADGLEIRRGVWWKHRIVVPHSRVQHSDIEQGPLQRSFLLATLIVNTAGTKGASVRLDGLLFETAERLRDALTSGKVRIDTNQRDAVASRSPAESTETSEST